MGGFRRVTPGCDALSWMRLVGARQHTSPRVVMILVVFPTSSKLDRHISAALKPLGTIVLVWGRMD